jgi:hypothetical protein
MGWRKDSFLALSRTTAEASSVFGAQGMLFAGGGIFGVKCTGVLKQEKS